MSLDPFETGSDQLGAALDAGVLTLTLNRPDARNALTPEMIEALADALGRAEVDGRVRCIALTGAGKAFCSGGDVKAMAQDDGFQPDPDVMIHLQRLAQRRTAGRLFGMPKPTIAAVNGPAAGAGLALALACDLRVMSDTAFFTTAFARVGLSGDFGGAYFMTALVGPSKARELYYLSERVSADEAHRLGLANWVCPSDDLEGRIGEIAGRLAKGPALAFRHMKETLNRALFASSLDDLMDTEVTHHVHGFASEDHQNAARAFAERREPVFAGR